MEIEIGISWWIPYALFKRENQIIVECNDYQQVSLLHFLQSLNDYFYSKFND